MITSPTTLRSVWGGSGKRFPPTFGGACVFYLIALLAPLPLGSMRPIWSWTWAILVAIAGIALALSRRRYFFITGQNAALMNGGFHLILLIIATVPLGYSASGIATGGQYALELTGIGSVDPMQSVAVACFLLTHVVLYFIGLASFQCWVRIERLLGVLCLAAGLYGSYGLIAYFGGNTTILWYEKWASLGALTSTFVNRNNFAAYMGLGIQCCVAYLVFLWGAHNRQAFVLMRCRGNTVLLLLLATIIQLTCLALTGSRAGVLAFLSGAIVMLSLIYIKPGQKLISVKTLLLIFLSTMVIASVYYLSGDLLKWRFGQSLEATPRLPLYYLQEAALGQRPFSGYGLGTFDSIFEVFRKAENEHIFKRAHNDYLELALGIGVPLAAIQIGLVVGFLYDQIRKACVLAALPRAFIGLSLGTSVQLLLHACVDFPFQAPAISLYWCAILTLVAAAKRMVLASEVAP